MKRFVLDLGESRMVGTVPLPRRLVFRVHSVQHFDGVPYDMSKTEPVAAYDERIDSELPVFRWEELE